MSGRSVIEVRGDDPRAMRLARSLHTEMSGRYGGDGSSAPLPVAADARWLLVLGPDDEALACGAIARMADPSPGRPLGEVKRFFVAEHARGRGIGADLHDRLVELARSAGLSELRLETGTVQPEAIALYESRGWRPIQPYGQYAADPRTRCYALDLDDEVRA